MAERGAELDAPVRRAEELDVLGGLTEKVAGLYADKMTLSCLL